MENELELWIEFVLNVWGNDVSNPMGYLPFSISSCQSIPWFPVQP